MAKRPRGSDLADTIETALDFIRSDEFTVDAQGANDLAWFLAIQGAEAVRRFRNKLTRDTQLKSTIPHQAALFNADALNHASRFPDGGPLSVQPDISEHTSLPEKTHTLSVRDVSTILAALRFWQRMTDDVDPATEHTGSFAPDPDEIDQSPLSHTEIDDLCERINFAD